MDLRDSYPHLSLQTGFNYLGLTKYKCGKNSFRVSCMLPGHADDTPSFQYYHRTDTFYCFGCDRGGDGVSLVYFYKRDQDPTVNIQSIYDIFFQPQADHDIDSMLSMLENSGEEQSFDWEEFNMNVSAMCRRYLQTVYTTHPQELTWIEKLYKIFDTIILQQDEATARDWQNRVEEVLQARYTKLGL